MLTTALLTLMPVCQNVIYEKLLEAQCKEARGRGGGGGCRVGAQTQRNFGHHLRPEMKAPVIA